MTTLTFPLSRIEGHAEVVIEVRGGEIISAHFKAMEIRGFQHFVKGVPAEQMPVIVPRICGVCSTAHHIASVKALEDAYSVRIPPLARRLRELMLLGQLIQNQASSLFVFTMPDRLGVPSIFEAGADDTDHDARAVIATRALQVRRAGTDLISLAGGQFIHPVKAVIGGVTSGITAEQADTMRRKLQKALPIACELFDYYWEVSWALRDRIGTWGDDGPAHYLAATSGWRPSYYGDLIHVIGPDGTHCTSFPPQRFRQYLTTTETDYSYAGQTTYNGETLRANSLARINMTEAMGTPQADSYLARFREAFGQPAHAILLFDLCRGIELVYAIELALSLLAEPLDVADSDTGYTPCDGEGFGLVEAPRGPLIHRYVIENGRIAEAEFVIPTVHNSQAIERALHVAAERHIHDGQVELELEQAVGRVVRAFDPCIACATH
ncbi:MAG: Ni/Fe hydrogenase subunit alpha [Anaerolineae bacterium]|nr:Ni/Fe hydrogenase subunit alpha [Anaerolineae bacterium]